MLETNEIALMVLFAALAGGIGWLLAKSRYESSTLEARAEAVRIEARLEARQESEDERKESMAKQMESIASEVSRKNSQDFLQLAEERLGKVATVAEKDHEARKKEMEALIKPMNESLSNLDEMSKKMEKERVDAYAGMKRHMQILEANTERLGKEANSLSSALRKSSSVRGDWGEIALRNLLEMAGMTKNTDFIEQKGIEGGGRPDFVVRLPGDGAIPIDAKTTGKHYLESLDEENPEARTAKLKQHAKAMRSRVTDLTRKEYRSGLTERAEFVVMFVPSEALISSAFEVDPELHADAMARGVIISGPASMIALLKTAALYWQQVRFADEAKQVVSVAQEFYARMATWSTHFAEVGKRLDKATEFYNKAVGSWERSVLPQGRKLEDLEIATNLPKTLVEPTVVAEEVRPPLVLWDGEEE